MMSALRRRIGAGLAFMVVACVASPGAAQTILVPDHAAAQSGPVASSPVQHARPRASQGGVGMDGSLLRAGLGSFLEQANPWEPTRVTSDAAGLLLPDTGEVAVGAMDLSLPSKGIPWTIGRTFNASPQGGDADSPQGWNWFQGSQPELVGEFALGQLERVWLIAGADRSLAFKRVTPKVGENDVFRGVNGASGALVRRVEPSGIETVTYYDPRGARAVFMGFDGAAGAAVGQLWYFDDGAGNRSGVGLATDTSRSDAIANGFDTQGRVVAAFDAAGRTYSYAYAGSPSRLVEVGVASPAGAGFACRVEYSYYGEGSVHGLAGDLRSARVTIPTSPVPGGGTPVSLEYTTYYRYYTDSARQHLIRLLVQPEGARSYFALGHGLADIDVASDEDLAPFCRARIDYDADRRASSVTADGDAARVYTVEHEANTSHATTPGAYTPGWARRVLVRHETLGTHAYYFDERAQWLGTVQCSGDLAPGAGMVWATFVERDARGCIVSLHTPANARYDHGAALGEVFSTLSGDGLVRRYERIGTGDYTGFVRSASHAVGSAGGPGVLDEWMAYDGDGTDPSNPAGHSVKISEGSNFAIRPMLLREVRRYPEETTDAEAGSSEATRFAYLFHVDGSGTSTLRPRRVIRTDPAVSVDRNGSGVASVWSSAIDGEGRTSFVKSPTGRITYIGYDPELGLPTAMVEDADTSQLGGVSIPAGFEATGASEDLLRRRTELSYDPVGRPRTVTLPTGRTMLFHTSRLADGRQTLLAIPRVTQAGEGSEFAGPVGCEAYLLNGRRSLSLVIGPAIGPAAGSFVGVTSLDPSAWISSSEANESLAIAPGSTGLGRSALERLEYSPSGATLLARRRYFNMGTWGVPGSTGFDQWTFGYDGAGRLVRLQNPAGTIDRYVYQAGSGRLGDWWRGTSDSDFGGARAAGTNDIVLRERWIYDDGEDGGNGYATAREQHAGLRLATAQIDPSPRVTRFRSDERGRVLAVEAPANPHAVFAYDNLGRRTSMALLSEPWSGMGSPDPMGGTFGTRRALFEWSYDQLGRTFEQREYLVDQGSGSYAPGSALSERSWFDGEGALRALAGASIIKTQTNRADAPLVVATCAGPACVSNYQNALTIGSEDHVLHERHFMWNNTSGLLLGTLELHRGPAPEGQADTRTGLLLGSNGLASPLSPVLGSSGSVESFQIDPPRFFDVPSRPGSMRDRYGFHATWHDPLDRPHIDVDYGDFRYAGGTGPSLYVAGANSYSDLIQPGSSPVWTSFAGYRPPYWRVTQSMWDEFGRLSQTNQPDGRRSVYQYDDAGRETKRSLGRYDPDPLPLANDPDGFAPRTGPCDTGITTEYDKSRPFRTSDLICVGINCDPRRQTDLLYPDNAPNGPGWSNYPPDVPLAPGAPPPGHRLPDNDIPIGMLIKIGNDGQPEIPPILKLREQYRNGLGEVLHLREVDTLHPTYTGNIDRIGTDTTFERDLAGRLTAEQLNHAPPDVPSDWSRRETTYDALGRVAGLVTFTASAQPIASTSISAGDCVCGTPETETTGFSVAMTHAAAQVTAAYSVSFSLSASPGAWSTMRPGQISMPGGLIVEPGYQTPALPPGLPDIGSLIGRLATTKTDLSLPGQWTTPPPLIPDVIAREGYYGIWFPDEHTTTGYALGVPDLDLRQDIIYNMIVKGNNDCDLAPCPVTHPGDIGTGLDPHGSPNHDPWEWCAGIDCHPTILQDSAFVPDTGGDVRTITPMAIIPGELHSTDPRPHIYETPNDYGPGYPYPNGENPNIPGIDDGMPPIICSSEMRRSELVYPPVNPTMGHFGQSAGTALGPPPPPEPDRHERVEINQYVGVSRVEIDAKPISASLNSAGDSVRTSVHTVDGREHSSTLTAWPAPGTPDVTTTTRTYDSRGNTADDGVRLYEYTPLGQLRAVYRRNPDGTRGGMLCRYQYDAMDRLASAAYDRGTPNTPATPEAQLFADDIIEYYFYDDAWRLVAVFRQDVPNAAGVRPAPRPYERFVHRQTGVAQGGRLGGSAHLDAPVLSQINEDWREDLLFERQRVFLQSVRGDVAWVLDNNPNSPAPIEQIAYDMWGVPSLLSRGADIDDDGDISNGLHPDGGVTIDDLNAYLALFDLGHHAADVDNGSGVGLKDAGVTFDDLILYLAWFDAGAVGDVDDNRFLYRGYLWDPVLRMYHVRHRVYDPAARRWLQPDPLGTAAGANLYAYCEGDPVNCYDPYGLDYTEAVPGWYNGQRGTWIHTYKQTLAIHANSYYIPYLAWESTHVPSQTVFQPADTGVVDPAQEAGLDLNGRTEYQRRVLITLQDASSTAGQIGEVSVNTAGVVVLVVVPGPDDLVAAGLLSRYGIKHILRTGKKWFGLGADGQKVALKADEAMALRRAAERFDYRKVFFDAHPELQGKVVVHHAVEQQVVNKYPGLFTPEEINALPNLRGIPNDANSELHLREIRQAWDDFYNANMHATREQVLEHARLLDQRYGARFDPPCSDTMP